MDSRKDFDFWREVADLAFNRIHNGKLQAFGGRGEDAHVVAPYQYLDYPPDPSKVIQDVGAASRVSHQEKTASKKRPGLVVRPKFVRPQH